MKIIITDNYDQMSEQAAQIIAKQVNDKAESVLGLATGSTPIGTYEVLVKMFNDKKVDFSKIKTANLDEYKGLTRDDDQGYYYFMNKHFFSQVNVDKNNTNIEDGTNNDVAAECAKYEETIKNLGGVDLQLLGIGHNGHIGFNEPADHFPQMTHCVTLDETTIDANARFFESRDQVPTQAYTMGIGTIMAAKKVLLIATGEDKADILYKTVTSQVKPSVPSTILQFHQDVVIVADKAAAKKLIEAKLV